MKKMTFIISSLFVFLLLVCCTQDLMDYSGKDAIYFNVRRGAPWVAKSKWAHQDYSTVEFGKIDGDLDTLEIPVKVTGETKQYDREFQYSVVADSTTASSPEDYEIPDQEMIIPANQSSGLIKVVFKRSERINNDTIRLQLRLEENKYFSLAFKNFEEENHTGPEVNPKFGMNKDANTHNIYIFDVISRPKVWFGSDKLGLGLFGKFSVKKIKLIMKLTGVSINDFSSPATMPDARATAISQTVSAYLVKKAEEKDPVLDEDGTMMFLQFVREIAGPKAWKPFEKPEDYYNK